MTFVRSRCLRCARATLATRFRLVALAEDHGLLQIVERLLIAVHFDDFSFVCDATKGRIDES